jgi:Porphobilinogen deaminase, C-terminal domain
LAVLHGGCSVPVGAYGDVRDGRLHLVAQVTATDGARVVRASGSCLLADAAGLGEQVAQELIGNGAEDILSAVRAVPHPHISTIEGGGMSHLPDGAGGDDEPAQGTNPLRGRSPIRRFMHRQLLTPGALCMPLLVYEAGARLDPIVPTVTLDRLADEVTELYDLGVGSVKLFSGGGLRDTYATDAGHPTA